MSPPLVFITGASSGIGQALAHECLRRGWRVALVARRVHLLQDWLAQEHPAALPRQAGVYPADVGQPGQVQQAAADCLQEMGVPDIVIANAGISLGVDISQEEDLTVLSQVLQTNVLGVAASFQPFIDPMRKRGSGRLVAVASVAGVRGLPGHAAYCASKAAVISLAESLRGELRGSGVKVVTLAPGYVATPLTARNRYPMPFLMQADSFARQALDTIALGLSWRVIPWPMAWVARLLRVLPDALFDRLLQGQPRKHRHTS
jgi:NAD(P)-dependent dehydrogenase (short-subunit alcohol dehydrogenase family)